METILQIAPVVSATAAIIALCVNVAVYRHGLKREVRIETLKKLSEIRREYFNTKNLDSHQKLQYLNELEYFSVGLNEKIYDIDIVSKMSGNRLLSQYEDWMKDFIAERQKKCDHGHSSAYCEIVKVMDQLKRKKGK